MKITKFVSLLIIASILSLATSQEAAAAATANIATVNISPCRTLKPLSHPPPSETIPNNSKYSNNNKEFVNNSQTTPTPTRTRSARYLPPHQAHPKPSRLDEP